MKERSGRYIEGCLRIPNHFKRRPSRPPPGEVISVEGIDLHSRKILGRVCSHSYVLLHIRQGMIHDPLDSPIHPRLVSWCRIQATSKRSRPRNEQYRMCTLRLGKNANSKEDLLKSSHILNTL